MLAEATAQPLSRLRHMLIAAGRAQEHISARVLMAPRGTASASMMVQVKPKKTQERLRPESFAPGIGISNPPGLLSRHHPCRSQTLSKPPLPTFWLDTVKKTLEELPGTTSKSSPYLPTHRTSITHKHHTSIILAEAESQGSRTA